MKKLLLTFITLLFVSPLFATELSGNITFDWVNLSQIERDAQIQYFHNEIFADSKQPNFTKQEFKIAFSQNLKDKDYKNHYKKAKAGIKETLDANLCAFYFKKDVLIIYAIQYKDNPKNIYYYDGFGKLQYVDIISEEYPNFPYHSKQYNSKGKLISAIYFKSHDMQYMYQPDGTFKGLWYKDKMFDQNGKQSLSRTNWGI